MRVRNKVCVGVLLRGNRLGVINYIDLKYYVFIFVLVVFNIGVERFYVDGVGI